MKEVIQMFSKELLELDRNTVEFMIEDMRRQIEEKDEQIKQLDEQIKQLDEQIKQKDEQLRQLDEQRKVSEQEIQNMEEAKEYYIAWLSQERETARPLTSKHVIQGYSI